MMESAECRKESPLHHTCMLQPYDEWWIDVVE